MRLHPPPELCTPESLSQRRQQVPQRLPELPICKEGFITQFFVITIQLSPPNFSDYLKFPISSRRGAVNNCRSRYHMYDKVFYQDRWIKKYLSRRKIRQSAKPLEQHLIVSYSPKYKSYQRKTRQGQIDRGSNYYQQRKI